MTTSLAVVVILIIGVCLSNRRWQWDGDRGGYTPTIRDKATYPKFYVHMVSALALAFLCWSIGIPARHAVALTIAGGVLYEVCQGFVNWLDIVADAVGAVLFWSFLARWW